MSVSMASGRKMAFISARVSGKDEGTGITRASRMGIGRGLMKGSCSRRSMRVAAGASWALWPRWEEEGGGRPATTSSFFCLIWLSYDSQYLNCINLEAQAGSAPSDLETNK